MKNETKTTKANVEANAANILSADEKKNLASCEASIRNGLKAFYNVGKALTVIRADRLYSTADLYFSEKWDMTRQRVQQLIAAYRIHGLLSGLGAFGRNLPMTESQCRPFSAVPEDMRYDDNVINIWSTVVTSGQKVTAKLVTDTANTIVSEYVLANYPEDSALYKQYAKAQAKAEEQTKAQETADQTAGTNAETAGPSASADQRELVRELKAKIAYLESALAAEQKAHQRTMSAKGSALPQSKLAKELFSRGFRAMSRQHHPDMGGDVKIMAELNNLKSTLGI